MDNVPYRPAKVLIDSDIALLEHLARGGVVKTFNGDFGDRQWQMRRIRMMLGAETQTHAVAIALRKGIIS